MCTFLHIFIFLHDIIYRGCSSCLVFFLAHAFSLSCRDFELTVPTILIKIYTYLNGKYNQLLLQVRSLVLVVIVIVVDF